MKKFRILLFCFSIALSSTVSAQTVKGLYVDGFINILGNTQSEDSLLNYAQSNGFNYLALYDLHLVHAQYDMTNFSSIAPLASFIHRAKAQYGIQKVGAVAENFWFFQNRVRTYNTAHTNSLEKFDAYNLEFEFWNTSTTGPSGYYCTTYLQPASLACDTAGAFIFYKNELRKIDSVATLDNVISETYVGWPTAGQAHQIAGLCDRVLVHSYVSTDATVYSYTQTRLSYFAGSPSAPVDIIVIFSSESSFMGNWLLTHPETQAFSTYNAAFQNDNSSWISGINLIGYQWFDYSNMVYSLPLAVNEIKDDNGISIFQTSNQLEVTIESKTISQSVQLSIFNANGQLISRNSYPVTSEKTTINIPTENMCNGLYFLSASNSETHLGNSKIIISK